MERVAAMAVRCPKPIAKPAWRPHDFVPRHMGAAAAAAVGIALAGSTAVCQPRSFHEPSRLAQHLQPLQETIEEEERSADPLRHVVRKTLSLSLDAPQVLQVAKDISQWSEFMPCCSESCSEGRTEAGLPKFRVHFGMRVGRVSVGDSVVYEVCQTGPGRLHMQSLNNDELTYCNDIRCTVVAKSTAEGSELHVELDFRAKNMLYLTVWQQVEKPLVEMIAARLKHRAMQLAAEDMAPLRHGIAH